MEQGQPRKKKLRLEEGLETAEENELSIATSPAEKRKVGKVLIASLRKFLAGEM